MKETILITGATGTVGSETVKALAGEDVKTRVGVHSIIKADRFRALPNIEPVHLDFDDPVTLEAAFTGVTKAFLITPFTEDQVSMAKTMIDYAVKTGVQHLVRLSASGADAEPGIQLGRWHREAEEYLIHSGIPYTILRPSGFMQNFVNYAADGIRNDNKIYMPVGSGKVSYIDARDIAAVAKVVLTQPGHENKIYELTGPEAVSVNDVAHAITQATNRVIAYIDVPEEAASAAMAQQHMPPWMVNAMMELNGIYKAGYGAQVSDTVEKLTGQPARTISDFAQDYASSFQPV
jgi:uncharacterized protein YbjT (DUF2867 family)